MAKKRFKALRRDHRLMIKVREIEEDINETCHALAEELGCFVGWSIAKELASGAKLQDLIDSGAVEIE